MLSESAVNFELFLTKKLIECRFVRETRMCCFVGHDVIVFISAERRLDVDQQAALARAPAVLDRWIVNKAKRDVRARGWIDDFLLCFL
jgi:hypothetical protein